MLQLLVLTTSLSLDTGHKLPPGVIGMEEQAIFGNAGTFDLPSNLSNLLH
jgi:hypothetical protein